MTAKSANRLADDFSLAAYDLSERTQLRVADILRARMLAIACGYEDADDLDHLRSDPGFKLACGRLSDSGADLCSQPTVSRWENAPDLREVVRLSYALVDISCASSPRPPRAVTLDIDDTVDVVHGHQQMSLFNAHYDERCFLPIHIQDALVGTDDLYAAALIVALVERAETVDIVLCVNTFGRNRIIFCK